MKKILLLILGSFVLITSCQQSSKNTLPRIAIAGLGIESSTFSPARTHEDAFHAKTGKEMMNYFPFLQDGSRILERAQWFPTLRGKALPGGIVTREAYESLVNQTLDLLKKNLPYDGLYLDIHGAMSVEDLDDAEANYIERIRKVVGYKTVISTCMDLHGNVSERLAKQTDLMTCYRMAPHEDAMESKQRAVENLLDRLESGKGKPKYKAWIPLPILLPGEKTSTRVEPAKSLYAKVDPLTKKDGVLDAGIWIGYAWADAPRNRAAVMVTGDNKEQVKESSEYLAKSFWDIRNEFEFIAPTTTFENALGQALESSKKPFIISDMGDNPTAGGAGDVTWTLNEILKRKEFKSTNGKSVIYASIPGPKFIETAIKAGIGNTVSEYAGAEVDARYCPPVKLTGLVQAIKHGDKHAETEVVVKIGSVNVIVTKKRKPYHNEKDFTELGLNPRETDIVFVKIGYLVPELYNMRGDWVMALTPGGVDQHLERLPYKKIERPMFPLDKDMPDPDISARFIKPSEEL